ncbi:MAG: hypothetical protein HBSAPP03_26510 [Phycisphaerae bacterium]|nr:MAG: hypothetical protein HBSAPP03_26510 [Phycisphaerae bacterium]
MSVAGAKGSLFDAMKDLRLRFDAVRDQWDDQTRRAFEREEIDPLEPKVAAALKAIDAVQELIRRVYRECGDDGEPFV